MRRLVLGGCLADDLERIATHLRAHEAADVDARLAEIIEALQVPERHPLIGRRADAGRRELVIGRGARGCIALHACDPLDDVAAVAALRSQREAGFGEA